MEKRVCKICSTNKLVCAFRLMTKKGKSYYSRACAACIEAIRLEKRRKIRDKYLEIKKTQKCCVCGNNDFRVLDYDHLDRAKKSFKVSRGITDGLAEDKIDAEIAKCQILCSNCHRIKTWEERNRGVA